MLNLGGPGWFNDVLNVRIEYKTRLEAFPRSDSAERVKVGGRAVLAAHSCRDG
jgi:hypothetical protein